MEDEIVDKLKKLSINDNNYIEKILNEIIEKVIFVNCEIILSKYQSKKWRNNCEWYVNGKHNECEKYQRCWIENITGIKCEKSNNIRINRRTNELKTKKKFKNDVNGFDYTEDFDGVQKNNKILYYFNLKMIVGNGGAQTRTLREVNLFIEVQLEYLLDSKRKDLIFFNILDGDQSAKNIEKYNYLINFSKYKDVKKFVFVGDLYSFNLNYENILNN